MNLDAPAIMIGHTVYQAFDQIRPASVSPDIIDGLLRRELGYGGVVLTDELTMWAIAHHCGVDQAPLHALLAGADMFFLKDPQHHDGAFRSILAEVESGALPEARLNASVARAPSEAVTRTLEPGWRRSEGKKRQCLREFGHWLLQTPRGGCGARSTVVGQHVRRSPQGI